MRTWLEKTHNASIPSKRKHHPAVTRHTKQATVPHAHHDEREQDERPVLAGNVNEDLKNRLAVDAVDGSFKILDRKQERHEHKEAKERTEANAGYDADGRTPAGVPGLFTQVSRGIKPSEGILGHQAAGDGDVGSAGANRPRIMVVDSSSVVELAKDERRRLVGGCLGQDGDADRRNTSTVQHDGDVVEIAQDADAKRVDHAVRDQDGGIYAHGFGCSRLKVGVLDGDGGGNEPCQTKGDSRGDSDLLEGGDMSVLRGSRVRMYRCGGNLIPDRAD